MAKIFQKNNGPSVDVKRNVFDLSFGTHFTGKLGQLIPVFCKEVIPSDSFQITPTFGIRFNPLVFPIQSKVHGTLHFWYVRNRNLQTKWPEYIGRTDSDVVHPYLHITEENAKEQIGTGSLGDYLGVPSTLSDEFSYFSALRLQTSVQASTMMDAAGVGVREGADTNATIDRTSVGVINRVPPSCFIPIPVDTPDGIAELNKLLNYAAAYPTSFSFTYRSLFRSSYYALNNLPYVDPTAPESAYTASIGTYGYFSADRLRSHIDKDKAITFDNPFGYGTTSKTLDYGLYISVATTDSNDVPGYDAQVRQLFPLSLSYDGDTGVLTSSNQSEVSALAAYVNDLLDNQKYVYLGVVCTPSAATFMTAPDVLPTDPAYLNVGDAIVLGLMSATVRDSTDGDTVYMNPYVVHNGEDTPKIRLNAFPFRAYESIYNFFYRDETIDPLLINGKPVYNDFIRTHADGADTNVYPIYRRNWERDYYTSCQHSPQQGDAPLVGISATGQFTFSDGTNTYTAQATIGDDNETITGISTYSPDMPAGSLRQLVDVVTNGISINDLRNVNSLQRWLETNIRRGYKYVDQIYSHFGINPAFKANDMPEFLGGVHSVADVNTIFDQSSQGLGDYRGTISMFGNSQNTINKFCDEHGYIIGIMCVYPEPIYSQMLPKHFLKTLTPLDYFFPEFGHIGMQPITYNEVCPNEVAAEDIRNNTDNLGKVFGYQRAWADYLASTDEVHGDFRTSLRDFVMQRVFQGRPELGHDFIAINDEDVNDVFVTTDDSDKILGQIRFDVKSKRPIPLFGVPSLE